MKLAFALWLLAIALWAAGLAMLIFSDHLVYVTSRI